MSTVVIQFRIFDIFTINVMNVQSLEDPNKNSDVQTLHCIILYILMIFNDLFLSF